MAEKTEGVDPWYEFAKDFAVGQGRPLHSHRRVQLLYASAGVMLITTPDTKRLLSPMQALWIPAGHPHSIAFLSDTKMRTLYFPSEEVSSVLGDVPALRVFPVTPLVRELIARFFEDRDEENLRLIRTLLIRLAAQAEPLAANLSMPDEPRLRERLEGILAERNWNYPAEDFARDLHMTPRTFTRFFRKHAFMTYREWRSRARLMISLDLLAQNSASSSGRLPRRCATTPGRTRKRHPPVKESGRRFADRSFSISQNSASSTGTRAETGPWASARTGTGSAGTARTSRASGTTGTAAGTTAARRRRTMSPMVAAGEKRGGAQSRGGRESEEKASRFLHLRLLLKAVRERCLSARSRRALPSLHLRKRKVKTPHETCKKTSRTATKEV